MFHRVESHGKVSHDVFSFLPVNQTFIKETFWTESNWRFIFRRFPRPRGSAVLPAVLLDSVCLPLSRLQPAHPGKLHLSPQLSLAPAVLRVSSECFSLWGWRAGSLTNVMFAFNPFPSSFVSNVFISSLNICSWFFWCFLKLVLFNPPVTFTFTNIFYPRGQFDPSNY